MGEMRALPFERKQIFFTIAFVVIDKVNKSMESERVGNAAMHDMNSWLSGQEIVGGLSLPGEKSRSSEDEPFQILTKYDENNSDEYDEERRYTRG